VGQYLKISEKETFQSCDDDEPQVLAITWFYYCICIVKCLFFKNHYIRNGIQVLEYKGAYTVLKYLLIEQHYLGTI